MVAPSSRWSRQNKSEETGNTDSNETPSNHDADDDDVDEEDNYSGGMGGVQRNDMREVNALVRKENLYVHGWRCAVMLMLIAGAVTVTSLTFISFRDEEIEDFDTAYSLFAAKVEAIVAMRMKEVHNDKLELSARLSQYAASTTEEWPFVTLPSFTATLAPETVRFVPLLSDGTTVTEWNEYSSDSLQLWLPSNRVDEFPLTNVYNLDSKGDYSVETELSGNVVGPYWEFRPLNDEAIENTINLNALSQGWFADAYSTLSVTRKAMSLPSMPGRDNGTEWHGVLFHPVFEDASSGDSARLVGVLETTMLPWSYYINAMFLPMDDLEDVRGSIPLTVILKNSCGQAFTYRVEGRSHDGSSVVSFLGEGEVHAERIVSKEKIISDLFPYDSFDKSTSSTSSCRYMLAIYPTEEMYNELSTRAPVRLTVVVAITFSLTLFFFMIYEGFLHKQKSKILNAAAQFNRVVASLFPSNLRGRLFGGGDQKREKKKRAGRLARRADALKDDRSAIFGETQSKRHLIDKLENGGEEDEIAQLMFDSKPIADLYTDTTIMFADIAGFTAWSSVREPSQVFELLETIYKAFDIIAHKRGVFKVETVGDCYVAVVGLPDPRPDHAVVMARFAHDCLTKMKSLGSKLELRLGPGSAELALRVGLHSGPVTGGVLRGEKSRFQLFGDTMNTASRMESNGVPDRIQISQYTADLLSSAGKDHWLSKREEKVIAKGKGEMQTYWLSLETSPEQSPDTAEEGASEASSQPIARSNSISFRASSLSIVENLQSEKSIRLVQWNVQILTKLLKEISMKRSQQQPPPGPVKKVFRRMSISKDIGLLLTEETTTKTTVLEEVKEVIDFPVLGLFEQPSSQEDILLDEPVLEQLEKYVASVALMYRENPFHNIDHATHVVMSVGKLLGRIVTPSSDQIEDLDQTYEITADPLTKFACVFSALIHDVDHQGVPNSQLVKDRPEIAAAYKGKSIAEQNSVDLAWALLMDDEYEDLRKAIYADAKEKQRFRQLVVNSVMATDIIDKDLKKLRNARWDKAFHTPNTSEDDREHVNRRATIFIEHLIQASDVSHTMQHWHIYRKWNQLLFEEMMLAHRMGRGADPSANWYRGEIGFFDFYIIPLAKKLKDCGVFGVSGDEYLNYAERNRDEWEARGEALVGEMISKFESDYPPC